MNGLSGMETSVGAFIIGCSICSSDLPLCLRDVITKDVHWYLGDCALTNLKRIKTRISISL